MKCRSTFVRRDLLLRHDRTVHAKDGGIPLSNGEGRRKGGQKTSPLAGPSKPSITIDAATLEQIEASSDGMVDLETAAMLMTDFQHKAAAAMTGHGPEGEGSDPVFSPDRAALLEPAVAYLSGTSSLPQVPWDAFITQPMSEHKANSISSQETSMSQPSFTSVSTIHPHQTQLPPIMERQLSGNDAFAHVLNPFNNSLPVSGTATPNALSPFPNLEGPVSPVNYRRSPGPSQALTLPKAPQVTNEEERNAINDRIRIEDSQHSLPDDFRLPSTAAMNVYLSTYFNLFHHHLPFLHPESFKPRNTSPALLLAALSIGALYTFEHEQAYRLHIGSKILVNQFLQTKEAFDSRKCPLWTMQGTLLNMIFESWSGDPKGLEWSCSIKSLLANVCFFLCTNQERLLTCVRWWPAIATN
jgi:hypothetical protein